MYNLKENKIREKYLETINEYIENQSKVCALNRKEILEKSKKERRQRLIELLGKPLSDMPKSKKTKQRTTTGKTIKH